VYELANALGEVVHLEIGQPDFETPRTVIDATISALRSGATRYTSNAGIAELREAVAAVTSSRYATEIAPERVVIASGAVAALHIACALALDPGDEILIPDPCWPNYLGMIAILGGKPVRYRQLPVHGMRPRAADIQPLITARTRAILLNSPSNPTGAAIDRDELEKILRLANDAGLFVISDEIYESLIFTGIHNSVLGKAGDENCLYVSGVSKSYAMTGFRLGWCILPERLIDAGRAIVEATLGCVNTSAQFAALQALKSCDDDVARMREAYRARREIVRSSLGDRVLGDLDGAFYAMIDVGAYPGGSLEFAKDLLKRERVAVAPGITFGSDWDHSVRIAYAVADSDLAPALGKIADFISARR
jgi:aspartate aminotransferase